jgi:hypothetical protein
MYVITIITQLDDGAEHRDIVLRNDLELAREVARCAIWEHDVRRTVNIVEVAADRTRAFARREGLELQDGGSR